MISLFKGVTRIFMVMKVVLCESILKIMPFSHYCTQEKTENKKVGKSGKLLDDRKRCCQSPSGVFDMEEIQATCQ